MSRARLLAAALAGALLAGCIDFVEPDVLGFRKPARLQVSIEAANAVAGGCGALGAGPGDAEGRSAARVCLRATLEPGATRLGEARAVTDSALVLLGVPVHPAPLGGGRLLYEASLALPSGALGDTVFHVVFPQVEGVEIRPAELRWLAVGPVTPDTVRRETGEPLRIVLDVPERAPDPRPSQSWDFVVVGDTAVVRLQGSGFPDPVYRVPAELLDEFAGGAHRATLRFTQRLLREGTDYFVDVFLVEQLGWAVVEPEPVGAPED